MSDQQAARRLPGSEFAAHPQTTTSRWAPAPADATPLPSEPPAGPVDSERSQVEVAPDWPESDAGNARHRRVTSEEFLASRRTAAEPGPAQWGWQGFLNRITGGTLKLKQSAAEQRHIAARAVIQRSFGGARQIAVVNPKGGSIKTTATLLMGYTFGTVRGGSVVAWDCNETRGTLGVRGLGTGHSNTARELLDHMEQFAAVESSRLGDLGNFVRSQGEAHFDLLASDDRAAMTGQISGMDVEQVRSLLMRFYKVLLFDTGNNIKAPNWIEAVSEADHLVVPCTTREDTGFTGLWMLDALEESGVEPEWLEQHTTAVLADPAPQADAGLVRELTTAYESRCASVHRAPFDPHLVGGGQIAYSQLSRATQESWLQITAAVARCL